MKTYLASLAIVVVIVASICNANVVRQSLASMNRLNIVLGK